MSLLSRGFRNKARVLSPARLAPSLTSFTLNNSTHNPDVIKTLIPNKIGSNLQITQGARFSSSSPSTDSISDDVPTTGGADQQQHSEQIREAVRPGATSLPSLTTLLFKVSDRPGALEEALRLFWKHDINMTRIESRPSQGAAYTYDFFVDFEGEFRTPKVEHLVSDLERTCVDVIHMEPRKVPWFPKSLADLDRCIKTLDAGADLESDHPGFNDEEYRRRRQMICDLNRDYRTGDPIPFWEYTAPEIETWGSVYRKLQSLFPRYACKQYRYILPLLEQNCGYGVDRIPQLESISSFLRQTTGFRLRPVSGLLSARDFLAGLAFKVFFSTQYIRHSSRPLYTPEPDICHELIGHAPMFADPDFAEFSHRIGLASLGASDEDIERLATCYWFSVEFGLCREGKNNDEIKAYGAGLLSSFGELEYSCSPERPAGGTEDRPVYEEWNPYRAAVQEYPITTYQPKYFVADSLREAKEKMIDFCDSIPKPFQIRYNEHASTISVDRSIEEIIPEEKG